MLEEKQTARSKTTVSLLCWLHFLSSLCLYQMWERGIFPLSPILVISVIRARIHLSESDHILVQFKLLLICLVTEIYILKYNTK